jgi:hypothetical protein
VRRPL